MTNTTITITTSNPTPPPKLAQALPPCREVFRGTVLGQRSNILSVSRTAESACEIDDKAYQQNQPKAAAADDGTTKVKSAAAE
jgi:hypothetical protein